MFGLDYGGFIPAAALKANGVSFVCRYLRELGVGEVHQLQAAGIGLILIHEHAAAAALGGFAQGARDGKESLGQADALGAPATIPIYYAVDFDASPGDQPTINEYFKGVASIVGHDRVGIYAGFWPLGRCFDAGTVKWGWQTYAWSGGQVDGRAHLLQYSNNHSIAGVGVDYNHSLKANFGQWPQPRPTPAPPARAKGKATFTGSIDFDTGMWEIHGDTGTPVWGSGAEAWSAEIQVDNQNGRWRARALPFNAGPLGAP